MKKFGFVCILTFVTGCLSFLTTACNSETSKGNSETIIDSDTDTNTNNSGDSETAATDTATDTITDTNSNTATDTATDTNSDTATDTATDTNSDTATDTITDTNSDTATDTATDTNSDTATDTDTDTNSDTATDTDTDTNSDTATDTATDTNSDTATDTDTYDAVTCMVNTDQTCASPTLVDTLPATRWGTLDDSSNYNWNLDENHYYSFVATGPRVTITVTPGPTLTGGGPCIVNHCENRILMVSLHNEGDCSDTNALAHVNNSTDLCGELVLHYNSLSNGNKYIIQLVSQQGDSTMDYQLYVYPDMI